MAKTTNPHGLSGDVGDLNFYKHPLYGWIVRKKRVSNAKAIATDPKFEAVREQMDVFGRASTYGKILRHAIAPIGTAAVDRIFTSRMTQAFTKVIRASEVEGTKLTRQMHLLNGMQLNLNANSFHLKITDSSYSKQKGIEMQLSVLLRRVRHARPVFCRVFAMLRRIDIENDVCEKAHTMTSKYTEMESGSLEKFSFRFDHTLKGGNLFVVVTVHFYERTNRKMYVTKDRDMYGGMLYYLG